MSKSTNEQPDPQWLYCKHYEATVHTVLPVWFQNPQTKIDYAIPCVFCPECAAKRLDGRATPFDFYAGDGTLPEEWAEIYRKNLKRETIQ